MKTYFGINDKNNHCCVIYCNCSIKTILKDPTIIYTKGQFYSTNWCGHDELKRTISYIGEIKSKHKLNYELEYKGIDFDMGHEYPFCFKFNTIAEVIPYDKCK